MMDRRSFLAMSGTGVAATLGGWPDVALAQTPAAEAYGIPLTLTDRRVTMDVMFNGKGPYKVVLDTGGQMSLVDRKFADQMRLPTVATRRGQRVGRKVQDRAIRQVKELIFGGKLRQENAVFMETDDIHYGDDAIASLASGFLASFDSELDLSAQQLLIFPRGGPARDGWHANDNAFVQSKAAGWSPNLVADARLGEVRFRPILDTGAPRGLLLTQSIVSDAMPPSGNWSPASKKGDKILRAFRSRHPFVLGPLTVPNPVVVEDPLGPAVGRQGIIGLEILRLLNLATDVKRNRLYMRASNAPAIAPIYNMSGLWIDRDGSRIVAGAVGKGSPAEQAGIKVGDRLDGMDFSAMIKALNGPAGARAALTVGDGTSRRTVNLVLTDYL